jgi:mannose-6-phosphate isomerase-like protein (cupin superfamily)
MNANARTLPATVDAGGVKFQTVDWAGFNLAHVHLPKGADAKPLLEGLPGDLCQAPHWGYVLKGSIHVTYGDGRSEKVSAGQVYHWPAGHTVRVDEDYEAIEFSPSAPMNEVLAHVSRKLKG